MAEEVKKNQSMVDSLTIFQFVELLWKKKILIVLFVIVAMRNLIIIVFG
jgi:LPS O-antigen subunit length determinant protein (WzzB/FepE family)